jgi:hypothetical protein
MCEMNRIREVFTSFVRMTLVCIIRAENGGIFTSHLDGFKKHFELGRIRGIDFRLAIKVKFD